MSKLKVIFKRSFKPGALSADKNAVVADVRKSHRIDILEDGNMSDGSAFVTVKIFVK